MRAVAHPFTDGSVTVDGCPVHYLALSPSSPRRVTAMTSGAGHHAMLDRPLILLTALRTFLADWDHPEPLRR